MATISVYTYCTISMPGQDNIQIGSKSVPYSVTLDASAPDFYHDSVYVGIVNPETILTIGTTNGIVAFKVAIFRPTVDMYLGWNSTSSDADNSVVEIDAGAYFILTSDSTTAYNGATNTRVGSGTARDISTFIAGNRGLATGRMDIWVVN